MMSKKEFWPVFIHQRLIFLLQKFNVLVGSFCRVHASGGARDGRKTPSYADIFVFLHPLASGFHLPTRRPLLATGLLWPLVDCGWHHVLEDSASLTSPLCDFG